MGTQTSCETRCAITVTLQVMITAPEPKQTQKFPLTAWPGQSLHQAMKTAGSNFSFESKNDVPDSGPYVKAVRLKERNGKDEWHRNKGNLFWTTVLHEASEEKPIDLNYKVRRDDTVFLTYSGH